MWHKIEYMWMCVCVCMHTNILIYVSIFGRGSIAEWLRAWVFRISEMDFNSNSVCLCSSNLMPLIFFPILKLIFNFSIQSSRFHFCIPTHRSYSALFVPLHPLTFSHLPNSWWCSSAPPDSCFSSCHLHTVSPSSSCLQTPSALATHAHKSEMRYLSLSLV